MPIYFTSGTSGLEHDGSFALQAKAFRLSLNISLGEVNQNPNLLENFNLQHHLTSFGALKPNSQFVMSQMKAAKPTIGVAIDNACPDGIYLRMAKAIKSLGISTVQMFGASMTE
jgi:hypothetical protein